jgi:hypothetical protein
MRWIACLQNCTNYRTHGTRREKVDTWSILLSLGTAGLRRISGVFQAAPLVFAQQLRDTFARSLQTAYKTSPAGLTILDKNSHLLRRICL